MVDELVEEVVQDVVDGGVVVEEEVIDETGRYFAV